MIIALVGDTCQTCPQAGPCLVTDATGAPSARGSSWRVLCFDAYVIRVIMAVPFIFVTGLHAIIFRFGIRVLDLTVVRHFL